MDIRREDGMALIIAMMAMLLMTALGVALVLTTSSETMIAGNFRNSGEALYAADAALERVDGRPADVPDWNTLLDGTAAVRVHRRPPRAASGPCRTARRSISTQASTSANCDKRTPCIGADMDAVTDERPWGPNNPRWQLYAYGTLTELMPTETINSPYLRRRDGRRRPVGDRRQSDRQTAGRHPSGRRPSCNPGTRRASRCAPRRSGRAARTRSSR